MTGRNHQCLMPCQFLQIEFDEPVLHPVLADLPGLAVGHEFIGVQRNINIQIIIDHHLKCFSFETIPLIFIDGPAGNFLWGPEAIPVNSSHGQQLI